VSIDRLIDWWFNMSSSSKNNNISNNSNSSNTISNSSSNSNSSGRSNKKENEATDSATDSAAAAAAVTAEDENTKKRKVWRTVNVSAGGGPPQTMTPEAAAKYIQQATASRGREVKISFGPSRPGPSVSFGSLDLNALKETAVAAAAATAAKHNPKGSTSSNNNNNSKNKTINNINNTINSKDGLPCSEAEMKALMSMFVEIMGMSMDTDKMKKATAQNNTNSNSNTNATTADSKNKKGPVFMFGGNSNGVAPPGWPDQESMAAATAGFFTDGASWEAIRRTYGVINADNDGDDGDGDSMPDLDDMREIFSKAILSGAATANDATSQASDVQTAGVDAATTATAAAAGIRIAPAEWESLEQVAIDDALEAEDRERKSSKKRDKKQRKKMKQKEEASQKAVEAAQKKRDKAILSWRSRVVSACQSGELSKLDSLLQESPLLRKQQPMYDTTMITTEELRLTRSSIIPHLEFMLPNIIAKNRAQLERGKETRHRLATYIISTDLPIAFTPLRSGRSALHAACFHGDLPFVQLVLDKLTEYDDTHSYSVLPESCLNGTCDDSGWAPLHYAAVSGSTDVLELLLANGCDVTTMTDDTHTWRER
jgi:hypothetical protein